MPAYVLFDQTSGRVLAIHREVVAGEETTVKLSVEMVLEAVGEPVVDGIDYGIVEVEERPPVRRGFRMFVDPTLEKVVELEVT